MPEERDAATRRYSRDMRRIREEHDISIEDIHEDTRIAKTLLESFEEGSIYDHPTFNRVYLRSFVRVYAEAIELAPDEALDALEAALDGTYGNGLAVEHCGEDPLKSEAEISDEGAASDSSQKEEDGQGPVEEEEVESRDGEDESAEDEYTGTEPPAGGVGGRGGIVGPARAVGTDREGAAEEKEDSFRTERSREEDTPSLISVDDGHSKESEEADTSSASTDSSFDDPPSVEDSSFWEEDDSSSDEDRSEDSSEVSSGATPFDSTEDPEPEQPQRPTEDPSSTPVEQSAEGESAQESSSVSPSQEEEASPQPVGEEFGIVGEPEEVGSRASSSASAPSGSPSQEAPARPPESSSGSGLANLWSGRRREMFISGVGILVLIGLLFGLGWSYFAETEPSTASMAASETTEDTTQAATQDTVATASSSEQPPRVSLSLGDTLYVTVVAETNVSELRVRRNGDLRRPYWIEEGEARVFPFTNQISFEENLDNARFFLGRYPYPSPERDGLGRIVIDRETVESFADTARGRPQSLSASVDTISLDDPVPGGEIE